MDLELGDAYEGVESATDDICLESIDQWRKAVVYCFRDAGMREYFDDHGWSLTSNQDGPFSVHFRMRTDLVFELEGVTEVSCGEKRVGKVHIYPAILCTPEMLEITVVSPGDPAVDPFSKRILDLVVSSIRECRIDT